MVWVSVHSKEYMYFYQYPDTSKMVWKTRHFGARKLIFIIPSIYVWYDLFFFHFALRSVALSQCQWCLECQTRHIVNFLQSLHQGVEITLFSSMFLKETVKQMLVHDSQSQFKNFWLESLDLHCLVPVCQLTVLSQNKYMCLVPNRSQEWTLYFWLFGKNFCPLLSVAI